MLLGKNEGAEGAFIRWGKECYQKTLRGNGKKGVILPQLNVSETWCPLESALQSKEIYRLKADKQ